MKGILLIFLTLVFWDGRTQSQQVYTKNMLSDVAPRIRPHAEANGNYELLLTYEKAIIDPGDSLVLKGFISGYGAISGAKNSAVSTV